MRKFNAECIVLRNSNYKDSDKIYTLYSKNYGKFTAFAKGVRKMGSRRGGNLDTLNHIAVSISETNDTYFLNEVVLKNSFAYLKSDLDRVPKAYYVIELLHRLLEEGETNTLLFSTLLKTLRLLNSKNVPKELAVSYFELSLLKQLGFALNFESCISCGRPFSEEWQDFKLNLASGGFVCERCATYGLKLNKPDAIFLNYISKGKVPTDYVYSPSVDAMIKMYIKDVSETSFRSPTIFATLH